MASLSKFPMAQSTVRVLVFCGSVACFAGLTRLALAQQEPPKTDVVPAPVQAPATPNASGTPNPSSAKEPEVSSHDTPATFKVRVNLVLVRVVVRDLQGRVIPNLKREDFQLFDNRKEQVISSFTVETPESHTIVVSGTSSAATSAAPVASASAPDAKEKALPQRFVAVVFDDIDMHMEDASYVRAAASHLFGALAPSDRVGMFTTSGEHSLDFTDDHEALSKGLLGIVPHPLTGAQGFHPCPEVTYYEADRIENYHDTTTLGVATEEAVQCAFNGDESRQSQAQSLAESQAITALNAGDMQTEYVYRHLESAMQHMEHLPGQRIIVFVSPGFILTNMTREGTSLIDRANRANIVFNTIDARGLYTPDVMGDISDPPRDTLKTAGFKTSYRVEAQMAQSEILAQLADGTGGTFFHNRNDVDEGLREAIAAPALSYLLGFSPQNLKIDGRYHTLKVAMVNKQKFAIQARHGYYAPRTIADPAEAAKRELQEALFSQEEIRDLPVDLQTQFFKTDGSQARLAVLTHVDVKSIHFRKAQGRSWDDLTIATAIFDDNGKFVTGGEKIVEMRLLEPTLERLSRAGFTVKSSFDIKPGTYLVRSVVRDAEGAQMAARNGAVNIPY
jgi:VWFA-related protein